MWTTVRNRSCNSKTPFLSWTAITLHLLCILKPNVAQSQKCETVDEHEYINVRRVTCRDPGFNFSRLYFSETSQKLIAGGTNALYSLDENLTFTQTVAVEDSALRRKCLDECNSCVNQSKFAFRAFCRLGTPFDIPLSSCLPLQQPFCDNWINLVQPQTDSHGNEHLITCGTESMHTNVPNCQVRSMTDLSVTDTFTALLNPNSLAPLGLLTMRGISTKGKVSSAYYTAGHRGGTVDTFFSPIFNLGFHHQFERSQLDYLERRGSNLLGPPLQDFSLTWRDLVYKTNPDANSQANTDQFTDYHLQYVYKGDVYVFASGVGVNADGSHSHGSYVWRYCADDSQNTTYIATLRRAQIVCTGRSQLRGYTLQGRTPTSSWKMHEMTSAVEVNEPSLIANAVPGTGPYIVASFETLGGLPLASSICGYDKEEIRLAFENNPGRNYNVPNQCSQFGTGTYRGCSRNLTSDFIKNFANIDFIIRPNEVYPEDATFSRKSVRPAQFPLFYREGVSFYKIVFVKYMTSAYIFATTRTGRVLRLVSGEPRYNVLRNGLNFQLIDEYQVGKADGDDEVTVYDMAPIKTDKRPAIAVSTHRSITKLPLYDCEKRSDSCEACIGHHEDVDPSCVWCPSLKRCGFRGMDCPTDQLPGVLQIFSVPPPCFLNNGTIPLFPANVRREASTTTRDGIILRYTKSRVWSSQAFKDSQCPETMIGREVCKDRLTHGRRIPECTRYCQPKRCGPSQFEMDISGSTKCVDSMKYIASNIWVFSYVSTSGGTPLADIRMCIRTRNGIHKNLLDHTEYSRIPTEIHKRNPNLNAAILQFPADFNFYIRSSGSGTYYQHYLTFHPNRPSAVLCYDHCDYIDPNSDVAQVDTSGFYRCTGSKVPIVAHARAACRGGTWYGDCIDRPTGLYINVDTIWSSGAYTCANGQVPGHKNCIASEGHANFDAECITPAKHFAVYQTPRSSLPCWNPVIAPLVYS